MQFTDKDLILLQERGIRSLEIERQLDLLYNGSQYPELLKSAKLDSGIIQLSEVEKATFSKIFEEGLEHFSLMKFIPASGAASRMFEDLLNYHHHEKDSDSIRYFFDHLAEFSFYSQIPANIINDRKKALTFLFEELRFNQLPKALIPFHQKDNYLFSAFDSHLAEALCYSSENKMKAHFTIAEDAQREFHLALQKTGNHPVTALNAEVNFSFQEKQTDTVAIDEHKEIVRDENDNILFRPGGHGALLKNLQALEGDIIFIRNIDNIVSPFANEEYVKVHKEMGGMLMHYMKVIYSIQQKTERGEIPNDDEFSILCGKFFYTGKKEINSVYDFVFRPLRICGMVKNEGEPGGGPFWVKEKGGQISLQIIESSQVNPSDHHQGEIFRSGTHFNPVDICCSIKNCRGEKYDLFRFRNDEYSFLANKSYRGKNITVLEHPGLWNGSMHHWLTLFVEIPITVFNPVKSVNDLLRPGHIK